MNSSPAKTLELSTQPWSITFSILIENKGYLKYDIVKYVVTQIDDDIKMLILFIKEFALSASLKDLNYKELLHLILISSFSI